MSHAKILIHYNQAFGNFSSRFEIFFFFKKKTCSVHFEMNLLFFSLFGQFNVHLHEFHIFSIGFSNINRIDALSTEPIFIGSISLNMTSVILLGITRHIYSILSICCRFLSLSLSLATFLAFPIHMIIFCP